MYDLPIRGFYANSLYGTNIGDFHMVNYENSLFKMRPSKERRPSERNTSPIDKHLSCIMGTWVLLFYRKIVRITKELNNVFNSIQIFVVNFSFTSRLFSIQFCHLCGPTLFHEC